MGYGYYILPDGREAGYGVEAECDREGCAERIDRGLGFLCGDDPDGHRDGGAWGCGLYFCEQHSGDHDCPNPHGDCPVCDEPSDGEGPWDPKRRRTLCGKCAGVDQDAPAGAGPEVTP